ncbi:MAG TPA: hypothetical protein VH141_02670 [Pseudonocardia sp.]|jgi:hypothetical protein|nr:hypothetical protein [Pseudonocardia sp.]
MTPDSHGQPRATGQGEQQVMRRFNEWLARHDVPVELRGRYRVHAERYLRWRANRADAGADRIQWRYYTRLRDHGATEVELRIARTSLALLGRASAQPA